MRVAAFQGRCADGDVEANLDRTIETLHEAAAADADFLVMPETYLSGYGARETIEAAAMELDDPRLTRLAAETAACDVVLLVGMSERQAEAVFNSQLIIHGGRVLGAYRKTMLTGGDYREMGFATDFEAPVWCAKGVTFGIIICADSSYVEVAQTMWWKGAQIIFSPHYNYIPAESMDEHRVRVRNNHVGMAALLGVPVVRANVVNWDRAPRLGYGDTAIFDASGRPVAEAGLFTETLIMADLELGGRTERERRLRIPMGIRRQLADAMAAAPEGVY